MGLARIYFLLGHFPKLGDRWRDGNQQVSTMMETSPPVQGPVLQQLEQQKAWWIENCFKGLPNMPGDPHIKTSDELLIPRPSGNLSHGNVTCLIYTFLRWHFPLNPHFFTQFPIAMFDYTKGYPFCFCVVPGNDDVIKKAFEQGVGAGFYAALMMFAMSGGWFYEFAPWVHICFHWAIPTQWIVKDIDCGQRYDKSHIGFGRMKPTLTFQSWSGFGDDYI